MAKDDAILEEIRERYDDATEQWRDVREDAKTDMRYVSGDPWEEKDRLARQKAGRPCLSLDELGQYFNQVVNDVRANPRGMKFSPAGNGANDRTAEFYAEKAREIEYRSKASLAYVTAFENAVQRSYGFARVTTAFSSERSFNQDLLVKAVPNPDLITPDPYAERPDGLDQEFCFVEESWDWRKFRRTFPKASVKSYSLLAFEQAPTWGTDKRVKVAEYWRVATQDRLLLALAPLNGHGPEELVFEDEVTPEAIARRKVLRKRQVAYPRVEQFLTNGIEILTPVGGESPTRWPGKFIPIVWCLGKVLYVDDGAGARRVLLSMTRLARDPFMLYCYYRSCEAELVGMTPKFPYFYYEGQLDADQESALERSNHEPVAAIKVRPTVEALGQAVLPFPQRNPYSPPIEALEVGAEAARRAIQAAMGVSPLPTSALRRNEKSGKALQTIEAASQKGSFHFVDHYTDLIEAVGVIIEDLMDKVYDTARDVAVRKADDTASIVRINDPSNPKAISTKGDHIVTVSTGPSFDSERERASDFADTLAQIPAVFAQIADLVVKLKNLGPIGDQIAERLTPPQYRKAVQGKTDPAAMAQSLAEAQQQLAQLTQAAAAMKQALDTEQAKQMALVRKAEIDQETQIQLQQMRDATAIRVAEINAGTKLRVGETDADTEALALALEADEAEKVRAHDVEMAELEHEQQLERAVVAHRQATEQRDQDVAGKMAVASMTPTTQEKRGAEFSAAGD